MIKAILSKWFDIEYPTPCKTCEVLNEQLEHALFREKELLERILDLTKPAIIPTEPVQVVAPLQKAITFRAAVKEREAQDRLAARRLDEINKMEQELNINVDKSVSS